jgi:transposase
MSGVTNTFLPLSYFCIHLSYVQSPSRRRQYGHLKHWNRHLLCDMKIQKITTIWTAATKIWELTDSVELPGCFKFKQNALSLQTVC